MFKDNCFCKKAFIYFLLTFLASAFFAYAQMNTCNGACPFSTRPEVINFSQTNVILFNILGTILNMLALGYFFNCIEAVIKQNKNILLPFFNINSCLNKGFKSYVAIILVVFILTLVSVLVGLFYNPAFYIFWGIVILFYMIAGVSFLWNFANDGKFISFFDFKKAYNNIVNSSRNYFKYLIVILGLCFVSIISSLIIEVLCNLITIKPLATMILTTLLSSLISTYLAFSAVYLIAKSIRQDSVV